VTGVTIGALRCRYEWFIANRHHQAEYAHGRYCGELPFGVAWQRGRFPVPRVYQQLHARHWGGRRVVIITGSEKKMETLTVRFNGARPGF
jgi:hypothetical protein